MEGKDHSAGVGSRREAEKASETGKTVWAREDGMSQS